MRWGQISLAVATAMGAMYFLSQREFVVGTIALVGLSVYIGVRWLLAWFFRVRHWHGRGTKGVFHETCPNCNRSRYRRRGDWILRCHSCGWTPGWPVVRWITRSVPSIQIRRTVIGPKLLVVVVAIGLIATGVSADITSSTVDSAIGEVGPVVDPQTGSEEPADLNRTRIELMVHFFVNQERQERGLSTLDFDPRLREIARYHSRDMVQQDYFDHTAPSGETWEDRYSKFGYSCRVSTGGNRYLTGAENIAHTSARRSGNETEIARGLVNQWMNSQGHRDNILKPVWNREGIGINISDEGSQTRVYATQNFC